MNYSSSTPTSRGYENIREEQKDKVEQVLFLLDKFCVGDEVYHELSMIIEGLPHSQAGKK